MCSVTKAGNKTDLTTQDAMCSVTNAGNKTD